MKILITGVSGQLGYDIYQCLNQLPIHDVVGTNKDTLDITHPNEVFDKIKNINPDIVIHCAAWTAVDMAEENKELVYNVNVNGTSFIARACQNINATMVYISTDYVFDGTSHYPYETEDDKKPINYYGLSKYLGEQEVKKYLTKYFIIRISWLFGHHGNNFVKSMLRLGKENRINVVRDQIGSPTYSKDLAYLISQMIQTNKYGAYHASNEGSCSWYEYACEIFKQKNIPIHINPITSEQYPTLAKRPKYSVLGKQSLIKNGFLLLPHWKESLNKYLKRGEK